MADVNNSGEKQPCTFNDQNENIFDTIARKNSTSNAEYMKICFDTFDVDRDGFLDKEEFDKLLDNLFSNEGKSYKIDGNQRSNLFSFFDDDKDGQISQEEFKVCWHHWLKQILDPVTALVIVDVQNDFIVGTLAIKDCPAGQDGEAVVPVINSMLSLSLFDVVIYSLDWHPDDHISFIENISIRNLHPSSQVNAETAQVRDTVVFAGPPLVVQKLWPRHCVQQSWGAKLHPDLTVVEDPVCVYKGVNSNIDSYSAFWDNQKFSKTPLLDELQKRGVTDVYVCGLAYDVCVGATAMHSLEHGFRTVLVEDACRGVSLEDIECTRSKLQRGGAVIVDSSKVSNMLKGLDRRPELGYQAAANVVLAKRLVQEQQKKA